MSLTENTIARMHGFRVPAKSLLKERINTQAKLLKEDFQLAKWLGKNGNRMAGCVCLVVNGLEPTVQPSVEDLTPGNGLRSPKEVLSCPKCATSGEVAQPAHTPEALWKLRAGSAAPPVEEMWGRTNVRWKGQPSWTSEGVERIHCLKCQIQQYGGVGVEPWAEWDKEREDKVPGAGGTREGVTGIGRVQWLERIKHYLPEASLVWTIDLWA